MELQIAEISGEISVADLRLIIRDNIRLWSWGVMLTNKIYFPDKDGMRGKKRKAIMKKAKAKDRKVS